MKYIKIKSLKDDKYIILKVLSQRAVKANKFNCVVMSSNYKELTHGREGVIDIISCLKNNDIEVLDSKTVQVLFDEPTVQSTNAAQEAIEVISALIN
jgi:hypothetical protein